jgi:integrase
MGFIRRLADKRYRIIYDDVPVNGKRQQKTETLEDVSKKDAEAILAERKVQVRKRREALENGGVLKDEVPFSELFEMFLSQKRMQKEENTIRRYDSLVKLYLQPKFGDKQARCVKPHHLTDAYSGWLKDGRDGRKVSAKTIRHVHELFRNILNWGVRRELLSRNIAVLISDDDLPKVLKPRPLALTEDEVRKLLDEARKPPSRSMKRGYLSAESWFYPAVMFSVYTGARRGEVLALRWSDLNLDKRTATIARSLTERMSFKPPKNDRTRNLNLDASLVETLTTHGARQNAEREFLGRAYKDEGLVFARPDGSAVDPWNYGRAVRDLILRAGVTPITLHGLRDTHASLCAKAGVALEVVSQRLGHASIGITAERYLHVYSERDAEAARAFSSLIG